MEWTKKADFADILREKLDLGGANYYQSENPFFILDVPYVAKISPPKTYTKAPRLSLEQRIHLYIDKLSLEKKQAWQLMVALAGDYNIKDIYPWMIKDTFKKMAKALHPDHNHKETANSDFQTLYSAYKTLI